MAVIAPTDPRTCPGAYVVSDGKLYELVDTDGSQAVLENCRTGYKLKLPVSALLAYRLIKEAPACPDTAEAATNNLD